MYDVIPVLPVDEEPKDEMTPIMQFPTAKETEAHEADGLSEDLLLSDIESFREHAHRLQTAIIERREQADALAKEVQLQKEESLALAATIAERKAEADGLVGTVEAQVDRVMRSLEENMSVLDRRVEEQVKNNREAAEEQTRAVGGALSEMKNSVDSSAADVKNSVDASAAELKGQVESLHTELSELSGKVHSENVRSFRNMKDLITGLDHRAEDNEVLKEYISSLRKRLGILIFLGVANLAVIVAAFLVLTGVFR